MGNVIKASHYLAWFKKNSRNAMILNNKKKGD